MQPYQAGVLGRSEWGQIGGGNSPPSLLNDIPSYLVRIQRLERARMFARQNVSHSY